MTVKITQIIVGFFLYVGLIPLYGQISGRVTDGKGETIPGISVMLEPSGKGVSTTIDGSYLHAQPPIGKLILVFSGVGFETQRTTVNYSGQPLKINIDLAENTTELESVVILGKSDATIIKELPFSVTSIDLQPLKTQNLDINQVLNTTSGVRIREEGGLGSNFNFSLNGFSGNQVKFFMDGIPMDNFGSSLSLNNIPVNLISRIEVYKGVVPIHLGSDALGGAVNVLTNESMKNYLDVSYSVGSFNTHRAAVISRYTHESTGFTINANAFFNYSDNNYTIDVSVPDPETGAYGEVEKIERFHDGYQSQTAQIEAGITDKSYADKLFLGFIVSSNYKEVQTGTNMTRVAGEVYTSDRVFIPMLKYQKKGLFTENLTVSAYATYNLREAMAVDTSSRIYNWHGDYTVRSIDVRSGELNWDKTKFRFNDRSVLATTNFSYSIGENHSISLNNTYSRYERVGEDPISYTAVPFSEPNILSKNITGLSYSLSLLEGKWKSTAFGKLFVLDALTREGDGIGEESFLIDIYASETQSGFGLASTYFLTKDIQVKASYENTYRLPEAREMFGNGLLLLSSPRLKAEKSKNLNLGFLVRHRWNHHEMQIEGGYLYRLPENLIRLSSLGVTSTYENLSSAMANILEGGVKYNYNRMFNFEVNASFQNILNNEKLTPNGGENYLFGDRIPNVPFLFGNASMGLQLNELGSESGNLAINWTTQFVEAFFLKWPSQGDPNRKYDIPQQISHSISVSYSLQDGKYNLSLSGTNLFNEVLFDNFMLQKPGRAMHVKFRYFISKDF